MYKLILFFLIIPTLSYAQVWDIGAWGGIANYQGDLNPLLDIRFSKPAYGGLFRYNFNPVFSVRGNFSHGKISANDAVFDGWQKSRNLNFKSKITEFAGLLEFNFKPFITGDPKYNFTSYLFTGIAVFRFNPVTAFNGSPVNLQRFGTEGQGSEYYPERNNYFLVNYAIPIGMGVKKSISQHWSVALETGARRTFTDYLDDVSTAYPNSELVGQKLDGSTTMQLSNPSTVNTNSNLVSEHQRGNSKNKDWYFFSGVLLVYNFKTGKCGKAFQEGYKWD